MTKLQDSDGEIVNTPLAMAEKFNEYFSNIASNLKTQISSRTSDNPSSSGFEEFLKKTGNKLNVC